MLIVLVLLYLHTALCHLCRQGELGNCLQAEYWRDLEDNSRLLQLQNPSLASEETWAHATTQPKVGGLLLATSDVPRPDVLHTDQYWQAMALLVRHSAAGSVGLVPKRPSGLKLGVGRGRLKLGIRGDPAGMQETFAASRTLRRHGAASLSAAMSQQGRGGDSLEKDSQRDAQGRVLFMRIGLRCILLVCVRELLTSAAEHNYAHPNLRRRADVTLPAACCVGYSRLLSIPAAKGAASDATTPIVITLSTADAPAAASNPSAAATDALMKAGGQVAMLLLFKAQDVIKAEGEKKKDVIAVAELAEPAAKSVAAKPAGNAKSSAPAKPAAQPADKLAAKAAKPCALKPAPQQKHLACARIRAQPKPAQPKAKPQQQPRPAMTAIRKATQASTLRALCWVATLWRRAECPDSGILQYNASTKQV
ncbi:hypothetical protein COO60DRAFT_1624149 [Scenedesmus sp. NREL 46B-D3]|nr:hypothetical protein COO60DRAFT_1624149 [Scenedesmus sp. NREL 46B-D3]